MINTNFKYRKSSDKRPGRLFKLFDLEGGGVLKNSFLRTDIITNMRQYYTQHQQNRHLQPLHQED